MSFDAHKNFAYSTVATAPSPASSGTSLVVASGDGAKFPAVPFNATVWPANSQPTTANAEIVRVTGISTDTFTITRATESTSARSIGVGDQIAATITAKTVTDIETAARIDGWTDDTANTWTYASATTFTLAGIDRTAVFTTGTRLRLKQGGAYKYFVVVSSAFSTDTTVTVTGGSDYTLANASITDNYYSYQGNPQGWPAYFNYTPTATGWSSTSTLAGRFAVIGRVVYLWWSIAGTSNSTSASFTLPITATDTSVGLAGLTVDNGTGQASGGRAQINGPSGLGSCDLAKTAAGSSGGWTNIGTKQSFGQIAYNI